MDTTSRLHRDFIADITRIVNKYTALMKIPVDIGDGETLTQTEAHIIDAVGNGYGRTVTELAGLFSITKGAVSQMTGKLADRGYIVKERDPEYWKEICLSLTERGRVAFKRHAAMHRGMDRDIIKRLETISDGKLEEFRELLSIIERSVDGYIRRYG
jgi:DNA-binding MarR family transcriptional regulator